MLIPRRDDGGIATLTLNRPEKLNALDVALMVALREQIDCVALNGRRVLLANTARYPPDALRPPNGSAPPLMMLTSQRVPRFRQTLGRNV